MSKEKELSEMTLEELWQLFPISLVPHDERWPDNYREAEEEISSLLKNFRVERISHIGSTAIKDIWAKNIVDILIEIPKDEDMKAVADRLENNGYTRMSADEKRISLNKGYTKSGFAEKVYHVHIRFSGDNDELYFRDYLNDHPETAGDYEKLKLGLRKKYEHNRDAYTDAKTDFIRRWTEEAKKEYRGRY